MNLKQSFYAMFYFLCDYYDISKNDDLGSLLGDLDPTLFAGGMPADPAAWSDWEDCVKKISNEKTITVDEAFEAMLIFLKFYNDEFGFNLTWILDELKKPSVSAEWNKCANHCINNYV